MISSAVEHFVDIEGVTGSIPVSSTMNLHYMCGSDLAALFAAHERNKGALTAPRDKGQN